MTTVRLEKELDEALNTFREEMIFLTDTHDSDYLTKDDLEQIGRQVFYCLHDFKKILMKHMKEKN